MLNNFVSMNQVHGNRVVVVSKKDVGLTIPNCDAMVTDDPNITLVVRTADCLPISLKDKDGRIHGVIHAGWRGLKNNIIKKTFQKIHSEWKLEFDKLKVVIGPHICVKHYKVKGDVAQFFNEIKNEIKIVEGKKYLDLGLTAKNQLLKLGISEENIKIDNRCVFENQEFFSYRRDKTDKRNNFVCKVPHGEWNSLATRHF